MAKKLTLAKGGKLTLQKANGTPPKVVRVELKWNSPQATVYKGKKVEYDVDACAFILGSDSKALENTKHFCFYNQQNTPAITSSGDDLGGDDSGEVLLIDLTKVPAKGEKISIVINLHEAVERGQLLSKVTEGTIELFDNDTNESLAYAELGAVSNTDTSVWFACLNRVGSEWEVENINTGFDKTLMDWVDLYGIDLEA